MNTEPIFVAADISKEEIDALLTDLADQLLQDLDVESERCPWDNWLAGDL